MKRYIVGMLFVLGCLVPSLVMAQAGPSAEAEERQSELTESQVKKVRTAFGKLSGKLEVVQTELKALQKFKGNKDDLKASLKRLKKATAAVRKEATKISEIASLIEWSKAPKIVDRIGSECETIDSVVDSLDSPQALNTSVRNEFKASARVLKKDLKKLGKTPPVAAKE